MDKTRVEQSGNRNRGFTDAEIRGFIAETKARKARATKASPTARRDLQRLAISLLR